MPDTIRTFGNIDPKKKHRETFTLQGLYEFDTTDADGTEHAEDEVWSEEFTCLSKVPAKVLDSLIASVAMGKDGGVSFDNLRICGFLRACLVPKDRPRWDVLMEDDARILDLNDDLGPILEVLAGGVFGRPTTPPSS